MKSDSYFSYRAAGAFGDDRDDYPEPDCGCTAQRPCERHFIEPAPSESTAGRSEEKMDRMMRAPAGTEGRDRTEVPLGEIEGPDGERYEHALAIDKPAAGRLAQGQSEQQRCGFCGGLHVGMCSAVVLRSQVARLREERDAACEAVAYWTREHNTLGLRVETLEGLLREIREELDQEADVDDGTPNLAMRLLVMIDGAALTGREGDE